MPTRILPSEQICSIVRLPSSKSISNRILLINALGPGIYPPQNLSVCDDTHVMTEAVKAGGPVVNIGAAGTAMRFLTAYFAVSEGERLLTGSERMQQRPIKLLVDALRDLGADIEYAGKEGYPPLKIRGKNLPGGNLRLSGNVSSQYISALLMIAPVLRNGLIIELEGEIISRPYINLTLRLMRDFGAYASWANDRMICVEPKPYGAIPFTVEADWSGASYWYEIVALSKDEKAEVRLTGLHANSYQGDSKVAGLFTRLGVSTVFEGDEAVLRKSGVPAESFEYDFIDQPDLAQTFAVTCCMLGVRFVFTGLQSLKIKETDRINALIRELGKLGYVLREENGSTLIWDGERKEADKRPVIDTYEDHRMAMAFAPVALQTGEILMNDPDVVSKSYPEYWANLVEAGFVVDFDDILKK